MDYQSINQSINYSCRPNASFSSVHRLLVKSDMVVCHLTAVLALANLLLVALWP